MAGRKPKPTAVKKLEGNPGKRNLTGFFFLWLFKRGFMW